MRKKETQIKIGSIFIENPNSNLENKCNSVWLIVKKENQNFYCVNLKDGTYIQWPNKPQNINSVLLFCNKKRSVNYFDFIKDTVFLASIDEADILYKKRKDCIQFDWLFKISSHKIKKLYQLGEILCTNEINVEDILFKKDSFFVYEEVINTTSFIKKINREKIKNIIMS